MKRIIVILTIMSSVVFAQPDGKALLTQVLDVMNPPNAKAISTQTILTTSGKTRTFTMDSYMGNKGENSLMVYRAPSRVRGNATLMTDYSDNIWMYIKRTGRVRKLASHAKKQKFEGSDFTYEDMGSGDAWKNDYIPTNKGIVKLNGEECYLLEMAKAAEDVSYSKLDLFVRVTDTFPVQIDYYDENGVNTKVLHMDDIRIIEGYPTAMKMVMENLIDKTSTEMETLEITYDVTFDEGFFTERNLKKL